MDRARMIRRLVRLAARTTKQNSGSFGALVKSGARRVDMWKVAVHGGVDHSLHSTNFCDWKVWCVLLIYGILIYFDSF